MYSIKETAAIFKVSDRTVKRWLKAEIIYSVKIGGTVRITAEEINRLKEARPCASK